MAAAATARAILGRCSVPRHPSLYVLGWGSRKVTVQAQQVRALELVWALKQHADGELAGKKFVIIGGGIAGVTAAAAARLFGAEVLLLEEGPALAHLQRGCRNRHLHPHIYDWPDDTRARRAGADLPILNWAVGSADEVAERILIDYRRINNDEQTGPKIQEVFHVRDVHLEGDVSWRTLDNAGRQQAKDAYAVILAVGFGVEKSASNIPVVSYWRMDSATQSPVVAVTEGRRHTVVVGTGDGGIIDVLRARMTAFDHGAFLDECVLRLRSERLREWIRKTETFAAERWVPRSVAARRARPNWKNAASLWLNDQYRHHCLGDGEFRNEISSLLDWMRSCLRDHLVVHWVGTIPHPTDVDAQPLNRILTWLLCLDGSVRYIGNSRLSSVNILNPLLHGGFQYAIELQPAQAPLLAHEIALRIGCTHAINRSFPEVAKALDQQKFSISPPAQIDPTIKDEYTNRRGSDLPSRQLLDAELQLHCHLDQSFPSTSDKPTVYRIELWLEGALVSDLEWVDYDLHPEYGAVHRRAMKVLDPIEKRQFRHWLYTKDDHWIRVRCSDGSEFGEWLSKVLQRSTNTELKEQCITDLRSNAAHDGEYWMIPFRYVDRPFRT